MPELLTPEQVAEILGGVTRRWVVDAAARKELPGTKVGRRWRFRRDLLDQYIERRTNPDPLKRSARSEAARRRRRT